MVTMMDVALEAEEESVLQMIDKNVRDREKVEIPNGTILRKLATLAAPAKTGVQIP